LRAPGPPRSGVSVYFASRHRAYSSRRVFPERLGGDPESGDSTFSLSRILPWPRRNRRGSDCAQRPAILRLGAASCARRSRASTDRSLRWYRTAQLADSFQLLRLQRASLVKFHRHPVLRKSPKPGEQRPSLGPLSRDPRGLRGGPRLIQADALGDVPIREQFGREDQVVTKFGPVSVQGKPAGSERIA
jgi:hypothetical protein